MAEAIVQNAGKIYSLIYRNNNNIVLLVITV